MSTITPIAYSEAREYIDREPVAPYVGGVLAAADVIPPSGHALMGAEYLTDACAAGGVWEEFCYVSNDIAGDPPTDGPKDLDEQPDLVQGSPFAVYAGVECDINDTEARQRAERRLSYVESRQVDAQVWALVSAGAASVTSATLLAAVSEIEQEASEIYGGVPTLLVPRRLVTAGFAQDIFIRGPQGDIMTHQGALVANVAVDDTAVLATGRITLIQGAVQSHFAPETIRPGGASTDPRRALAERIYVPLFECFQLTGATA